jgi:hypothetical protein
MNGGVDHVEESTLRFSERFRNWETASGASELKNSQICDSGAHHSVGISEEPDFGAHTGAKNSEICDPGAHNGVEISQEPDFGAHTGVEISEISNSGAHKLRAVERLLAEHAEIFCRQGYVVETWRGTDRRRGPFYRLRYRQEGRQRSIYLGCDPALAEAVRCRLRELQAPLRWRREGDRLWAKGQALYREFKAQTERELRSVGLRFHGNEVRGARRSPHWFQASLAKSGPSNETGAPGESAQTP